MNRHRFLGSGCVALLLAMLSPAWAVEGTNSPYGDAIGDIDPGIATGDGTLDIVSMEVSNTATDVQFTLTVNGNVSTTDWGNFMIGIATGSTATENTGNGWSRPIQLNSPIGGMDYWIGSWASAGGGAQLWSYNGASWDGPVALGGFSFTPGAQSTLSYTVTTNALGVSEGDTFYFDAYSSGGGGTDSAVDALSNPNVSITSWGQSYTSKTTGSGGVGLNAYNLAGTTRVVLYDLYLQDRGGVMGVCWQTASEEKSVGFDLFREENGAWVKVNVALIAAQGSDGMGAAYEVSDAGANATDTFRYKLVEYETDGEVQEYGPFDVAAWGLRLDNVMATPEGVTIRWLGRAQDTYEILKSVDLRRGFESLAVDIPGVEPVTSFTDKKADENAFYRIRAQ